MNKPLAPTSAKTVGRKTPVLLAVLVALLLRSAAVTAQTESVLYQFAGGNDGGLPAGGLVRDEQGNLYGTSGGDCGDLAGYGTVFKISPQGTETVLYRFTTGDESWPENSLVRTSSGSLYGVTFGCFGGGGTLFEITPAGQFRQVYRFGGAVGTPTGGLVTDSQGNLYGVAYGGGSLNYGSIFEVSPSGIEKTLYTFTSASDGWVPIGTLLRDADGNLYGATQNGGSGSSCTYGCGVVFELAADGAFSVLYNFTGGADGAMPMGGLLKDKQGNLYGTAYYGGNATKSCPGGNSCGVVFKLSPTGVQTVLHAFHGGDGGNPNGGLIRDSSGNLYGTTVNGGHDYNSCDLIACGVAYKLTPEGTEIALHGFNDKSDGGKPQGYLIRDPEGSLYGTTVFGGDYYGVVFKLTP